MGFYINFSEFDKLKKSYSSLSKDFDQFLKDFLIDMAERIITKTKPKTPKDTGALRSHWDLGKVTGSGKEIEVEILNPMEYATEIEYGHRIVVGTGQNKREVGWYNGHFMLKTSIDEIQQQMPLRFERQFKAFCQAHGINNN